MSNNIFLKTLAVGLLFIQLLAGCKTSEKPFPDNGFESTPGTEKPFPDNTSLPVFWHKKSDATANKNPEKAAQQNAAAVSQLIITKPTSFRGIVPCSDCEQIELILTLRPDQVFFLRKEFKRLPKRKLDREQEIGGWELSDDGKQLLLKRGDNSIQTLAMNNSQQLEILNAEGKRITANGSYTLKRMESALSLIDSTRIQGMYFENKGRGYWLECQSGVTWPVARAGDYVKLSQQYNALNKPTENSNVLAKFTAHFATRTDKNTGDGEFLVVDDFTALENRFSCP